MSLRGYQVILKRDKFRVCARMRKKSRPARILVTVYKS